MTVADRIRERKICEAVVRALEAREATARCGGFSPEDLTTQYPECERVEWVASIGAKKFALEVTLVQATSDRIKAAEHLEKMFEPIVAELKGALPLSGIYKLVIPPGALSGIKNRQLPAVRQSLTEWIRCVAPHLGARPSHFVRQTPANVGFEVTLYRFPPRQNDGCLRVAYAKPENLADEQRIPVRKMLKKKLPKLSRWQAKGAAAVLIVETRDIAQSDEHLVAEMLVEEMESCSVALDHVFIIDTAIPQWAVYMLKPAGQSDPAHLYEVADFNESELPPVGEH